MQLVGAYSPTSLDVLVFIIIYFQVEALLAKTGGAIPIASAPVKQHEKFLEETKSLLHPGNFQVREGGNA